MITLSQKQGMNVITLVKYNDYNGMPSDTVSDTANDTSNDTTILQEINELRSQVTQLTTQLTTQLLTHQVTHPPQKAEKRHTGDTKQIKGKNNIKETTTGVVVKKDAAKAATLSRKDSFYLSLVPYVGKYPKEMIRAFFDYWSELNKSGTKMRYELEKTWELPKRLVTWANRERMPLKPEAGIVLKDNSPEKYTKGW